jgi:hypothetical protein
VARFGVLSSERTTNRREIEVARRLGETPGDLEVIAGSMTTVGVGDLGLPG